MESVSSTSQHSSSWKSFDEHVEAAGHDLPIQDSERYVSYRLEDLWPTWQANARCADVGVNYYFGDEKQQPTMSIKQVRQASKLCEACPVFDKCLRHALTYREEYGVWAGTSGRVRRKIFALLEADLTTVDEVIERYLDGQGDYYRHLRIRPDLGEGSPRDGDGDAVAGDTASDDSLIAWL